MSPSLPPLGADVDAVIFLTPVADEATDAVPVITPESSIWKLFKPGILNLVIEALPNVISFDTVAALTSANDPITILLSPLVKSLVPLFAACFPISTFESPVVSDPAACPTMVLQQPVA